MTEPTKREAHITSLIADLRAALPSHVELWGQPVRGTDRVSDMDFNVVVGGEVVGEVLLKSARVGHYVAASGAGKFTFHVYGNRMPQTGSGWGKTFRHFGKPESAARAVVKFCVPFTAEEEEAIASQKVVEDDRRRAAKAASTRLARRQRCANELFTALEKLVAEVSIGVGGSALGLAAVEAGALLAKVR